MFCFVFFPSTFWILTQWHNKMSSTEENITTTSQMHMNVTLNALYVFYLSCATYLTYSLLSIPLHTYVVWLIVTGPRSGIASELFTLNLSMCEIIYSFMALVTLVVPLLTVFSILLLFIGRPLFQTLICVERYIAVIHPVCFLKYKPLRYRLVISGLVWLIVLSCSMTFAFTPSPDIILTVVLIFGVPSLLLMLFCCLAALRGLKQSQPGENRRPTERVNHAKVKAFKLILFILLLLLTHFILCLAIQVILHSVGSSLATLFTSICFFLVLLTGLSYPLGYIRVQARHNKASKLPGATS